MTAPRQGDLFDDNYNDEMERLADALDEADDLALEKELEKQGGRAYNPASDYPEDHPYISHLPKNKDFNTDNYWEGAYSRRSYGGYGGYGRYTESWTVKPVKSASEYLRSNSYWGSSYYSEYYKKSEDKAIAQEALHEVLKELNKTINLTSNSATGEEEVLSVKYSNGNVYNDLESNTLYVSPNIMLESDDVVKTGDNYYQSLDGLNGQAMLCAFMKKGIHPKANSDYKTSEEWAARNIFMTDIQSTAASEVYVKWPGFMSYITSQMQVFGQKKKDILEKFKGSKILLDDLIEMLCYNRLGTDKIDYTEFHPDFVKKMLLADKDFNEQMDLPCAPENRFEKAKRIFENVRDILNLDKVEVDAKFGESGLKMPPSQNLMNSPSSQQQPDSKEDGPEGETQQKGEALPNPEVDNTPSAKDRSFTGDNSYNNYQAVDGDIVTSILDHNKKLRERLKELADSLQVFSEEDSLKDATYKLLVPPVNAEQIREYDEFVKCNRKNIGRIKDSLLFHNNMPHFFNHGLTDGDVDEHALYKVAFGDCERIFEKREVVSEKSYHITLVLDQSGSMSGSKLSEAGKLCILFSEALNFLRNTQHSIYGFETREINTWVYKDKLYDKTKALINPKSEGGTAMGYHLGAIGDKVLAQYGEFNNKFMFVITDGEPTHGRYGLTAEEHTAKTIKLLRSRGIKVFGIGILNAFNEATGKKIFGEGNFMVINDIAGTLPVLTTRLRKYLQTASKF